MAGRPEPSRAARAQRGVALLLVLWLLAGLAMLAASLAGSSRVGVRSANLARSLAVAESLGDAAINLTMAELASSAAGRGAATGRELTIDGKGVSVSVVPLNGFININTAEEPLLEALLQTAGQLAPGAAKSLAQRILDWRDPDASARPQGAEDPAYAAAGVAFRTRGTRFEAIDDLMQVLGMTYEVFDKIRPLVVAGGTFSRVNPMAAPLPVLVVLASGNASGAERFFAARQAGTSMPELSDLNPAFIDMAEQPIVRVEATVELAGRRIVRAREIRRVPSSRGLPWESIRIDPARVVAGG